MVEIFVVRVVRVGVEDLVTVRDFVEYTGLSVDFSGVEALVTVRDFVEYTGLSVDFSEVHVAISRVSNKIGASDAIHIDKKCMQCVSNFPSIYTTVHVAYMLYM